MTDSILTELQGIGKPLYPGPHSELQPGVDPAMILPLFPTGRLLITLCIYAPRPSSHLNFRHDDCGDGMSDVLDRCAAMVKASLVGIVIGSETQFETVKGSIEWADGDEQKK